MKKSWVSRSRLAYVLVVAAWAVSRPLMAFTAGSVSLQVVPQPHEVQAKGATPFERDVCAELSAAARKQGVRIGWYFSPMDWRGPDFRTERSAVFLGRMQAEVRELLSNYGPIDLLWFDWDEHEPLYDQATTYPLVKSLQPRMVISNRLDLAKGNNDRRILSTNADYYTPEQHVGACDDQRPWESCMTLSSRNQWAWGGPPDGVKSLEACLNMLIDCAGGDGNLLLNVGPMPTGEIPPDQANRLGEIGAWLAKYGESIYGTRGGPFKPGDYGASTRKGNTIYIHIREWDDGVLKLPAIPAKVLRSRVLTGGKAEVRQPAAGLEVAVLPSDRQPLDTIVALELDGEANRIPAMNVPNASSLPSKAKATASNVYQKQAEHNPEKAVNGNSDTRWATDTILPQRRPRCHLVQTGDFPARCLTDMIRQHSREPVETMPTMLSIMKPLRYIVWLLALLGRAAVVADEAKPPPNHRTDWFRDAKWGVFMHYMADTVLKGDQITVENWNKAVDAFDVNGLADQLASVGAGYFVLTLGQNSGFYCAPNATYDKLTGFAPSKCARRDLVSDLSDALRARKIRLMVYLPCGAPDRDKEAMKALEWKAGQFPLWSYENGKPKGQDDRLVSFQKKWESVIVEWSKRWGKKVSGWWFDGCYYPDAMYRHPEAPNFASFAAAVRSGNSDSIVAFNPGVLNPIITLTPEEDYTAGEINEPDKVVCQGRWVGAAHFHMLSYLGPNWCQKPPRFNLEQVVSFTGGITEKEGTVTWDVPPAGISGHVPDDFLAQLKAVGDSLTRK